MKICPRCGSQVEDSAAFCTSCGAQLGVDAAPVPAVVPDPSDHTAEFDPADIAENKIYGILVYLLGTIGVIITLLAAPESGYARFHVRQSLKLTIVEMILSLAAAILCWTFIVPIAAGIAVVVLFVVQIICFFRACKGQAKEAPIIKNLGFLK